MTDSRYRPQSSVSKSVSQNEGPTNCRYPGYGTALLTILVFGDLVYCLKQQQESLFVSNACSIFNAISTVRLRRPVMDGIERLTVFSDGGSKRPLTEIAFLQIPANYLARMDAFQYVNSAFSWLHLQIYEMQTNLFANLLYFSDYGRPFFCLKVGHKTSCCCR